MSWDDRPGAARVDVGCSRCQRVHRVEIREWRRIAMQAEADLAAALAREEKASARVSELKKLYAGLPTDRDLVDLLADAIGTDAAYLLVIEHMDSVRASAERTENGIERSTRERDQARRELAEWLHLTAADPAVKP
jgi:hypothetical protein